MLPARLPRCVRLALALASMLACACTGSAPPAAHPAETVASRMEDEVNQVRRQRGLDPVTLDERLTRAAQAHSEDMAYNDFVGHHGSDGTTGHQRGRAAGYPVRLLGENLQMGLATVDEAVAAWMESPAHRENLLRPQFEDMGIGYVFLESDGGRARYGHYWTLVLAAPR